MWETNRRYYQPSGYNTTFDFKDQSFEEYIDFNRRKIRLARLDLKTDYPETIIEANSPFAWFPRENSTEKNAVYCSCMAYSIHLSVSGI